jgi:hypothetical protein
MRSSPTEGDSIGEQLSVLLEALESGELTADSPSERRLRRRLEGAASAVEALDGEDRDDGRS